MLLRVSKDTAAGGVTLTVVLPLAPVVQHVRSCLILVDIP